MQGGGLVLVGAKGVMATHNAVFDNRGATPLSGGIVLQARRRSALARRPATRSKQHRLPQPAG